MDVTTAAAAEPDRARTAPASHARWFSGATPRLNPVPLSRQFAFGMKRKAGLFSQEETEATEENPLEPMINDRRRTSSYRRTRRQQRGWALWRIGGLTIAVLCPPAFAQSSFRLPRGFGGRAGAASWLLGSGLCLPPPFIPFSHSLIHWLLPPARRSPQKINSRDLTPCRFRPAKPKNRKISQANRGEVC